MFVAIEPVVKGWNVKMARINEFSIEFYHQMDRLIEWTVTCNPFSYTVAPFMLVSLSCISIEAMIIDCGSRDLIWATRWDCVVSIDDVITVRWLQCWKMKNKFSLNTLFFLQANDKKIRLNLARSKRNKFHHTLGETKKRNSSMSYDEWVELSLNEEDRFFFKHNIKLLWTRADMWERKKNTTRSENALTKARSFVAKWTTAKNVIKLSFSSSSPLSHHSQVSSSFCYSSPHVSFM